MNHKQKLGYTLLGAGIMAINHYRAGYHTEIEARLCLMRLNPCRLLRVVDEKCKHCAPWSLEKV